MHRKLSVKEFGLGRADLAICLAVIISVMGLAHFWITDRLSVLRAVYPLEAAIVQHLAISCSNNAPYWLRGSITRVVSNHSSLSNQIAYVESDGTVHECVSGWKGAVFRSEELNDRNRFRYASLSKLVTADAVLKQVHSGNLKMQDRLLDLLPELTPVGDARLESITVEHLLTHSAGFDRIKSIDPMFEHATKPWCPYALDRLRSLELDNVPGENYSYSNIGYCLLGVVLERVTGKPYRQLISDQYGLDNLGIEFVDGPYRPDEVAYDFRNSDFYTESYSRFFDFNALSSSAGLSGNASALATLLYGMSNQPAPNIASSLPMKDCAMDVFQACYGYAGSFLKRSQHDFFIQIQGGLLPGTTSASILDSEGGVLIWLGNGTSLGGKEKAEALADYFHDTLLDHYVSGFR